MLLEKKQTKMKDNRVFKRAVMGLILLIVAVLWDYGNCKILPSFFFCDAFDIGYVESYWSGIFNVIALYATIMTLWYTAQTYKLSKEKQYLEREIRERELFQKQLDDAVRSLTDKYENEAECLLAIEKIRNIINVYRERLDHKNLDNILVLVKKHVDQVLSVKGLENKVRADVKEAMLLIYNSRATEGLRYRVDLCSFEDVCINSAYLNVIAVEEVEFTRVTFVGETLGFYHLKQAVFRDCIFQCDVRFSDYCEDVYIDMDNCKLQGLNIIPPRGKSVPINVFRMNKCDVEGFVCANYNEFQYIQLLNCEFKNTVQMRWIKVECEFLAERTKFLGMLNMESCVMKWKIQFLYAYCYDLFYIWDSMFWCSSRVCFSDLYIKKQHDFDKGNFSVCIGDDKQNPEKTFGDKYKLVYLKEKDMYTLKHRSNMS